MRLLLTTSAEPLFAFGTGIGLTINYNKSLACHRLFRKPKYLYKRGLPVCSIKTSANGHFTEFSTHLRYLASQFWNASPLKEFQWVKAKLMVEERLIVLGKNAVQWSLIVLLCFSFVSDAVMAVSINREMFVPLGLFMGVMLANFLKEFFQEIFESSRKGGNDLQRNDLLQFRGIGLFFVALRIICLSFRILGWVIFAHIGNGGLMQTLWLAKELQPAGFAQTKEEVDSLLPSRD